MIKSAMGLSVLILSIFTNGTTFYVTPVDTFTGYVISIEENSFVVETETDDGETITKSFTVTEDTRFYDEEGEDCTFEDLEVYVDVEVTFNESDESCIAKTVNILE